MAKPIQPLLKQLTECSLSKFGLCEDEPSVDSGWKLVMHLNFYFPLSVCLSVCHAARVNQVVSPGKQREVRLHLCMYNYA